MYATVHHLLPNVLSDSITHVTTTAIKIFFNAGDSQKSGPGACEIIRSIVI